MNIFNKTFRKLTHFLQQNHTSKFKFQNSKISDAPLRRFLTVYTEILAPDACLRRLRSFRAAMKRLRHVDVTKTLTSSGVDIHGLPGGGLLFLLQDCRKHVCRRKINRSLHPKLRDTSAARVPASKRPNSVFL